MEYTTNYRLKKTTDGGVKLQRSLSLGVVEYWVDINTVEADEPDSYDLQMIRKDFIKQYEEEYGHKIHCNLMQLASDGTCDCKES